MAIKQKISTCLWFANQAEEAAKFYTTVFKNSKISKTLSGPDGKAIMVSFILDGVEMQALNGNPRFELTESTSLSVNCETQAEVDDLWKKLTADGGEESMCGWLKDKYGLSWQIVPTGIDELFSHPDREKANRAMQAMMKMRKLDIAKLKAAFNG
jgi:predicted 3-demethylubiquinone-9 3-methyltransferase (glyoxalase superfamily)